MPSTLPELEERAMMQTLRQKGALRLNTDNKRGDAAVRAALERLVTRGLVVKTVDNETHTIIYTIQEG